MRCPKCGGEITLEDKFCRYCGAENKDAARHIADMEHYKADYNATKTHVYKRTRVFSANATRVVILMSLLVLIFITFLIGYNSWSITREVLIRDNEKNYPLFSKQIEKYLEDGEYSKLAEFSDERRLYSTDAYDGYHNVLRAASEYRYFINSLLEQLEFERNPKENSDRLYGISSAIGSFKRSADDNPNTTYYLKEDPKKLAAFDRSNPYVAKIKDEMVCLLMKYGKFEKKEAEQLFENDQIHVALELEKHFSSKTGGGS